MKARISLALHAEHGAKKTADNRETNITLTMASTRVVRGVDGTVDVQGPAQFNATESKQPQRGYASSRFKRGIARLDTRSLTR
jgi:hypothetical protein